MKKVNKKELSDKTDLIVSRIKSLSKENEIEPHEVTKKMLLDSGISDWTFKRSAGLNSIKQAYFPIKEKDLAGIAKAKKQATLQRKFEDVKGKKLLFEQELLEIVKNNIQPLKRISPPKFKPSKTKKQRELVAMLNDTHVGLIVDPEEINGTNSFDFEQAGRRFAMFVKEVADYKRYRRDEVSKLHLILNGDLICGDIHSTDTNSIHLMVHQQNALMHILIHAISFLATEFKEVVIHGIAGNHCRLARKNNGQRAVVEVYDSYVNMVFYSLSTAFRNSSHIKFEFPKTPYGFIDLPAGRAMYAHGDHIFSKYLGNPGNSINVKGLTNGIRDFNAGEVAKGNKPIKLMLFGHVHVYAHFITSDGVEVYISPSLSGLDQFAHSLTINNNFCAQPVFESTEKYILGDSRLVRLMDADKDKSLDKIIPTYKKELKWQK